VGNNFIWSKNTCKDENISFKVLIVMSWYIEQCYYDITTKIWNRGTRGDHHLATAW
jgi:hypothetical protein